jgi:hypothetical protein
VHGLVWDTSREHNPVKSGPRQRGRPEVRPQGLRERLVKSLEEDRGSSGQGPRPHAPVNRSRVGAGSGVGRRQRRGGLRSGPRHPTLTLLSSYPGTTFAPPSAWRLCSACVASCLPFGGAGRRQQSVEGSRARDRMLERRGADLRSQGAPSAFLQSPESVDSG